jgi:hypothetical protein
MHDFYVRFLLTLEHDKVKRLTTITTTQNAAVLNCCDDDIRTSTNEHDSIKPASHAHNANESLFVVQQMLMDDQQQREK